MGNWEIQALLANQAAECPKDALFPAGLNDFCPEFLGIFFVSRYNEKSSI